MPPKLLGQLARISQLFSNHRHPQFVESRFIKAGFSTHKLNSFFQRFFTLLSIHRFQQREPRNSRNIPLLDQSSNYVCACAFFRFSLANGYNDFPNRLKMIDHDKFLEIEGRGQTNTLLVSPETSFSSLSLLSRKYHPHVTERYTRDIEGCVVEVMVATSLESSMDFPSRILFLFFFFTSNYSSRDEWT